MPTDIIEMLWECPACKRTVLGRFKACSNCGQFRPPDVKEWMPDDVSHAAAVKDAELLGRFSGGEDRHCEYCGSSQWNVDKCCKRCGSPAHPEEEIKAIEAASELPISRREQDIPGGRDPDAYTRRVSPDWPPKPVVQRKRPSQVMYEDDFGSHPEDYLPKRRIEAIAILVGVIGLIGLILYLIFHTVAHPATVTATQWTHTTEVQRNQVMHHDGWDPPGDAFNVHNDGRRVHHYDHVVDHYDTVSYTYQEACGQTCTPIPRNCSTTPRNCTSNKNGSATCTGGDTVCTGGGQSCSTKYCSRTGTRQEARYRDDPVYRDYFDWDVWEWVHNRNVVTAGMDTKPYPPTADQIKLGERERTRDEETYTVTFTDDDDHETHSYTPGSLGEFQTLPKGTKKVIDVGTMGGVSINREKSK